MGTFGEKLQREREMRGITLEEIAEATKIGTRSLRALEEQDFDKLPGGIFNKGFVRAYSKYLGIDEDQAVADYVDAVNEAQASGKLGRAEVSVPAVVEEETEEPVHIPWVLLISAALLVAFVFAARSYYAKHGWQKLTRQPVASQSAHSQPQSAQPQPVATTTSPATESPVTPSGAPPELSAGAPTTASEDGVAPAGGFVVKVHANELSWVSIQADGKLIASETMSANADRLVPALREVVIKTGNAGGIKLSQDGKPLPPIGPKHEVRTVTVTAHGTENVQ